MERVSSRDQGLLPAPRFHSQGGGGPGALNPTEGGTLPRQSLLRGYIVFP